MSRHGPHHRFEDMSPLGFLELYEQDDGDIIVVIHGRNMSDDLLEETAQVEFCTSGGQSPNTLHALRKLMEAMDLDNKEYGQSRK